MTKLLRYLPGVSAAVLAYAALKVMNILGLTTSVAEFALFIAVYLILTIAVEKGMTAYGTPPK